MTRTTSRVRRTGALGALLFATTARAAIIDFEGSTRDDDLAAIDAAVAPTCRVPK